MLLRTRHSKARRAAFTLVELLVVIAIIGVLAGLLVPALGGVGTKAKIAESRKQMEAFKTGVSAFYADYSAMPVSSSAQAAVNAASGVMSRKDFIYGASASMVSGYVANDVLNGYSASPYEANNSELMLILTAQTQFPANSTNSVNANNVKNPRKTVYLRPKQVTGSAAGGLGSDGVYRDPWGSPYIVTIDLNFDDFVAPAVYREHAVSQSSNAAGLVGLAHRDPVGTPDGNSDEFGIRGKVAVWSLGPDKRFSNTLKANASGVIGGQRVDNNDNVLSWQ